MHIPARTLCDWCHADIGDVPYTTITVPLPESSRQECYKFAAAVITPAIPNSLFGAVPIMMLIPHTWTLTQCLGCTQHGLIPDIFEKIRQQVREHIERKLTASQHAAAAIAEVDEA